MKTLLSLCTAIVLLTACSKKEVDPKPAPLQTASINLSFDFYATSNQPAWTLSFSSPATQTFWKRFTDRLMLRIDAIEVINHGDSRIEFVLPVSRQKTGLVGSYSLASQPDINQGDVLVTLTRPYYNLSTVSANLYTSNSERLTGSFIITSYDAARQLISGSYSVDAPNVQDPQAYDVVAVPGDIRRWGDLHFAGIFQEVPLQ